VAAELAHELSRRFDLPAGHTLPRIWSASPKDLREEYLTERFRNCTISPNSLPIHRFVWRDIWNLNVDDVVETIYRSPASLQKPCILTFRDRHTAPTSLEEVNLIHLHGSVSRPTDGYVFSVHDYGTLTALNSVWPDLLADHLVTHPFIVIGSTLEEYDIEHHLALRQGIDAERDPLPSLLISHSLDPIIEATAARFGLQPIEATASEFLNWLLLRAGEIPTPMEILVPGATHEIFRQPPSSHALKTFYRQFYQIEPASLPQPLEERNFLRGYEPTWFDISQHHDVTRADTSHILDTVQSWSRTASGPQLFVVNSPAGAGKTALLMRTAYELARAGHPTFYFSGSERLSVDPAVECLRLTKKLPVVVVDKLVDHAIHVVRLLDRLSELGVPAFLLAAERNNQLRRFRMEIGTHLVTYHPISSLDQSESLELVRKMRDEGLLGRSAGTEDAILAAQVKRRDLLAAICELASDERRFDRIVLSQWETIGDPNLERMMIAVSLSHSLGYHLRFALAERCSGIDAGVLLREIGSGTLSGLIFREGYGYEYLRTAHRVIAERLIKTAVDRDEIFDVYCSLARGLAKYVSPDTLKARTVEARLGGRLMDFDASVYTVLGISLAGKFYTKVKKEWGWNSRYWEQVAGYYVYIEDFAAAIESAQHAVGLERHPLSFTTLGHALSRSAIHIPANREYFYEAVDAYKSAISLSRSRRFGNVHAYHSAVSGAIAFVKRYGPILDGEVLAWIEELIQEAGAKFPYAFDWNGIAATWRRALRSRLGL
jgi:hypothetical protein